MLPWLSSKRPNLLTKKWSIVFSNELARFAYAQLDIPAAVSAYEKLLELTADDAGAWAWLRALSHNILDRIKGIDCRNLDRAQWHCTLGWNITQRYLQLQVPQLRYFRDMLLSVAECGCPEDVDLLIGCKNDIYSRFECTTEGD